MISPLGFSVDKKIGANVGVQGFAKAKNQSFLKTNEAMQFEKQNPISYAKIPLGLYQISFMGEDYHDINSKREWIDYGANLYLGPITDYIRDNDPRSRARAKAVKCDLSGKDLSNYIFKKGVLYDSDLSNTTLENATFEDCNMIAVNLKGAKTRRTDFTHANLCDADFSGAQLGRRTDMTGANLMGANLEGVDLSCVCLKNALYNKMTKLPDDIDPDAEGMIKLESRRDYSLPPVFEPSYNDEPIDESIYGQGYYPISPPLEPPKKPVDIYSEVRKRFERAKIRNFIVFDSKFDNNSFKRADLKNLDAHNCSFKNVILTRAYVKNLQAVNCDFSGAKMKQINLDNAEFQDVDMSNADLRGAIFTFKSAENLKLYGTIYDQYTVFNSDFDPKDYGMTYRESSPETYGLHTSKEGDYEW